MNEYRRLRSKIKNDAKCSYNVYLYKIESKLNLNLNNFVIL